MSEVYLLLSAIGLKTCIICVVNSNFFPSKHSHLCPDVGASQPPVLLNSEEVDQEKIYLLENDKTIKIPRAGRRS